MIGQTQTAKLDTMLDIVDASNDVAGQLSNLVYIVALIADHQEDPCDVGHWFGVLHSIRTIQKEAQSVSDRADALRQRIGA